MATVYQRPGSPFWYFDVTVGKKRKRVSTKRTLKREAQSVADSYRTKELDRIQHGSDVQELTLREALFDHYLPTKIGASSYADLSRDALKIVGDFPGVEGVKGGGDLPFHELTTATLRAYRVKRAAQGKAAQTIDLEIKVVSAAYHLIKDDYRVRAGLKFPIERPKGKPRPLTPDEETALLADLDPDRPLPARGGGTYILCSPAQRGRNVPLPRAYRQRVDNYDLVVMLLDTGCRFGEIAKLTWDMVDTVDWKWLHIFRTKVDNEGTLAITKRVRSVLERRYADRGNRYYVFQGWADRGDDFPRGSTRAIRRAMQRIGINHPSKITRYGRRDVRSLRDTFASKLRRSGMSLDRLQKLLGHASPVMTAKYADLGVDVASTEAAGILNQLNSQ